MPLGSAGYPGLCQVFARPAPRGSDWRPVDAFQYLALMGACLLLTLPLEFVFQARVYRRPWRLLRALVPVLAIFGLWDAFAIARGHWDFAERYVTGWHVPGSIPFEELVFFLVIPICAILTFEASRRNLGR